MSTVWTMAAEPSVIPWAILNFTLRVNMKEWAFFIVTSIESGIEITFRHLGHVIFVEEFTLVAFLTETSQPMFANDRTISSDVSVGTLRPIAATSWLTEEFAHCRGGLVHSRER